jgi:hypothetical protein
MPKTRGSLVTPAAEDFARLRENRDHWAKKYVQTLRERDRARDLAVTYLAELMYLREHGGPANPYSRIESPR